MMVRLTHRQHGRLIEIVSDQMSQRWSDSALDWLETDVVSGGSHRVDVAMPAIAWWRVRDVMFDHCFDNRGFRSKGVKVSDQNAMKAIQRAVNVRLVHPALSKVAAIGQVSEIIPAWRLHNPEGPTYSPVPADGEFVVLAPETRMVGAHQKVTSWVESKLAGSRPLLSEAEHNRFG